MAIVVTHIHNGWIRVEDTSWNVHATISPRGIVHPSKVLATYGLPRMVKVLERCFELKREKGR